MEALRPELAAAQSWRGTKEHNWRQELPPPARLAMFSAWATLVGALLLTVGAWQLARQDATRQIQQSFAGRVADIEAAVLTRMRAHEQILRGARGLFAASDQVSRGKWHAYFQSLQLEKNYPGIQGVGFAQHLAPGAVAGLVRQVRAEGFPDYDISPPGQRDDYTAIVFLEPFDWRNQRAFGYDMFTEPVRRQAMEAARDGGQPALSGKVTLVQETGQAVQAGAILYLAVYRPGAPADTPAQRRQALTGYVYSAFRMNDLMAGILGQGLSDVDLRIYDGDQVAPAALMYDSRPASEGKSDLVSTRVIQMGGRPWTLEVSALPALEKGGGAQKPRLILGAGVIVSLLMFVVVWSLTTLRRRATQLAEDMTAALRESREQFRAVAETAHDAIISADGRGNITFFNRAAEVIFGCRRVEVIGQPLTRLMPERMRPLHQAAFDRRMADGESGMIGRTLTVAARRLDGAEFPVELSIASWATAEGTFFTAILRDISERIAAEAKIRQLNSELQHQVDQLAEANRDLESFSYSVSHDLRAPLRAISGFVGLLERNQAQSLPEEDRKFLDAIKESSRKMSQLIDALLAFARLGPQPVSRATVDMARLVEETIVQVCSAEGQPPVGFEVDDLPQVQGDEVLLRQVWTNLIANAIKFTRPQAAPRVEVGGQQAGGELHYYVRDNGVGFDMAYASKLFGVFQRLHRPAEFPGTGVGLAIVHRIITKHGGRVWAEGEAGKGATFHFTLPGDGPLPQPE